MVWSDLFALTIEHSPAALAVLDRELRFLIVSRHWSIDLGVDAQSLVGRSYYDVFPNLPVQWRDAHLRSLTGSVERCEEERFVRPDGQVQWIRWEIRPWHAASGEIGGLLVFAETITEQKRVQQELQQSDERLRLAVTAANLGTWHWNLRTGELIWSVECLAMFGLPAGTQMTYERFAASVHPEDRSRVGAAIQRALSERCDYDIEYRNVWSDGSIHWTSARGRAYYDATGVPLRMEGIAQDITPRRQGERALAESERRFRDLAEGMPHMLWQLDPHGTLIYANHGWCRYFGRTEIELFQWEEVVHPDDLARVLDAWPEMSRGETNIGPFRMRRHDGIYRWFTCRSVPARSDTGELLHVIGISSDVDDLKQAEEALRTSQASLKAALQAAGMGTWVWEADGDHLRWDESLTQLFGLSAPDAGRATMGSLVALAVPEDRPAIERALARALRREADFDVEYRALPRDGGPLWIAAKGRIEEREDGQACRLVGACVDVTRHKRLEEELRQAQKMEAIGQLAGGIAHDFNNLLTVILGQASIAQFVPGVPERTLESIRDINDAAERAASLTAQLLAFGRRQVMSSSDLVLDDIVFGVTSMLERLLGEHIALVFEPSGERSLVHADPNMMGQVLLNLAINARDAMPRGGKLKVATRPAQLDASSARTTVGGQSGDYVCLSVTDSGMGISQEVMPHIFEPFFTTKELGKGTGLGLATVYGIVKQHDGWLSVSSEPGHGSTFEIYLPRVKVSAAGEAIASPEPEQGGRGELILLVEDDPSVRNVIQTVLEDHGYLLISAAGSAAALEVWRDHGEHIDLLLTDLVMPDSLTGLELASQLQAQKPGLKTILCSGHSAASVAEEIAALPRALFLHKPYRPETLLRAVRQLLDAS
jgi:two-component system cell cycle sensor histidine kinase/response regulator CckA